MSRSRNKVLAPVTVVVEEPVAAPEPLPPPAFSSMTMGNEELPPANCSSCVHYLHMTSEYGRCRRFPPSLPTGICKAEGQLLAQALVKALDYCGEFAPAAVAS